ncbi:hypothetical protein GC093_20585 [Paenibacillus sp. LMG 31456]|uniref:Uncharacterized protein n=1 Tax=Paenibacillus foliorum TaxID=2654974 RepID=A0A972GSN5_9BACL|nr:hypothetical protein [Paenibacillus foliorum]NOU95608.1 hypothetical protein [Paenibacillus foliorum]
MKWRTIDWFWLLTFTLFAQGMAFVYKDWLMQIVSYGSTFVSLALGAVAIYISVREATKGDNVKDQINVMLAEVREKVSQMDTKLNNFDPREFNKEKDIKIDEISENIKNELQDKLLQQNSLSQEEIIAIVNEKVELASEHLKSSLTISNREISDQNISVNVQKKGTKLLGEEIFYQIVKEKIRDFFKSGDEISVETMKNIIKEYGHSDFGHLQSVILLIRLRNEGVLNMSAEKYYKN